MGTETTTVAHGSGAVGTKRALLVLVLLSPWLAAVWVGLHNLRQPRQLQLLTSATPALPIGGWLLLSSTLGMTLGATAVGVLLRTEYAPRRSPASLEQENMQDNDGVAGEPDPESWRWRDVASGLGEPPPIVDVPFRVVRAGRAPDPDPHPSPSPIHDDDDWEPPESETW